MKTIFSLAILLSPAFASASSFIPDSKGIAVSTTGWVKTGANIHQSVLTDSVGIGVASPSTILEISATEPTVKITGTGNSTLGEIFLDFFGGGRGLPTSRIKVTEEGGAGFGEMQFWTRNGSGGSLIEAMVLEPNGDVGVGTSAPSERFEVVGGIGFYVRTKAQLEAITPGKAGTGYYCSDCLNSVNMVVSTGTTISGFDTFVGGTAWH